MEVSSDQGINRVTIDHLFLSHADKDHVEGLIPLLNHPRITINAIHHNGIGQFDFGFNTDLGNLSNDNRLTIIHDFLNDLNELDITSGPQDLFADWIQAVSASGATYGRLDRTTGIFDEGDSDITCEIVGPVLESNRQYLRWFSNKSYTINGHSLVFRLSYRNVRTFFTGDLNIPGSEHLLTTQNGDLSLNAHIFKAPHRSNEFCTSLLEAVHPMITIVSSGERYLIMVTREPTFWEPLADIVEVKNLCCSQLK